jgi:hypothetical protein
MQEVEKCMELFPRDAKELLLSGYMSGRLLLN